MNDGSNVIARVVQKNPTFPWDSIWKATFDKVLDIKLMDFQWRLSHHILYTGQRIAKWGMGDGICPYNNCNVVETVRHMFWECPEVAPVVSWTKQIYNKLFDNTVDLKIEFFLYGFTADPIPNNIYRRLWYIFSLTKFIVWKCRCTLVFEGHAKPGLQIKSDIIREIKLRIRSDYARLPFNKFVDVWTNERSFVHIVSGNIVFDL